MSETQSHQEPGVLSRCMGSVQRVGSLCFSSPTLHTGLMTFQRGALTGLVHVGAQAKESRKPGLKLTASVEQT